MSDYLFRLKVPANKRSFTVEEALTATSETLHPEPAVDEPVVIQGIDKVVLSTDSDATAGLPVALDDDDWDTLHRIWLRLGEPEFPMPLAEWQPYLDAFNSSESKPKGWSLSALQRDPQMQCALKRAIAMHDHREVLARAVNRGVVALRNPVTGIPSELGWVGDADSWLLSRAQMTAFCELLGVELVDLPHFITSARAAAVPPGLLALPAGTRVSYEENIGTQHRSGFSTAAAFRAEIEEAIARQSEGYFTLNEASQMLADSRPDLQPMEAVKAFLSAHAKGELPVHKSGSRFPLERGEKVRRSLDLLEATALDAWLRKSAGYGFPAAPAVTEPQPAPIAAPKTAKQPRRTWRDVAWDYMVERMRSDTFATATELNHTLHSEASGGGSPFDKGEGSHRGSLWVREIAQPLALKTIQNCWGDLRAASKAG